MPRSMPKNDYRTFGYVLRRTNYGEADRILNIITPQGKIAAIARAARKEKSKLAGGIEMFSLVELNIHQGKSELAIITGSKMVKFYKNILKDYNRVELAGRFLKWINKAADGADSEDYYSILKQSLEALDGGYDLELIESWFWLNLCRSMGEEMNLYRDNKGQKLLSESRYTWDVGESAFLQSEHGEYGVNEIKMLRLMVTTSLKTVGRVKVDSDLLGKVLGLSRVVAKV